MKAADCTLGECRWNPAASCCKTLRGCELLAVLHCRREHLDCRPGRRDQPPAYAVANVGALEGDLRPRSSSPLTYLLASAGSSFQYALTAGERFHMSSCQCVSQ